MEFKNKNYYLLALWIVTLVTVGAFIGSATKNNINTWYVHLNRSDLTPPNYFFPIIWSIFYTIMGITGWLLWNNTESRSCQKTKSLFIGQLILNWAWSPLFFILQATGISLLIIIIMIGSIYFIILNTLKTQKIIAFLNIPYLGWLLFAAYLNAYIWMKN